MQRRYPQVPLVGLGAVVFRGEQVLLVKRGHEPSKGIWTLPGGLLDLGEGLKDGIKRELEEECGIRVEVKGLVEAVDRIERDETGKVVYHYVILDYLAEWVEGEVVASSDADDACWVRHEDLADYGLARQARAVIDRARLMREEAKKELLG